MVSTSRMIGFVAVGLRVLPAMQLPAPLEPTTFDILYIRMTVLLILGDAVRAIDLYPHDLFDGHPVNESIIFAYEPPSSAGPERRALARSLLDKKHSLSRRLIRECYNTGNWVSTTQLASGLDTFCSESTTLVKHEQYKQWWRASDGNWYRFTNQVGAYNDVYFYVESTSGSTVSYSSCFYLGGQDCGRM